VVGVWAGPRTPGTAYNLLHHALGELDGMPGVWGQVIGGMGAISQAIARSAESAGATIRTDAEVASVDIRDGRAVGVTLASGEEIRAPIVASGLIRRPRSSTSPVARTSPPRSLRTCAATGLAAAR
jgi:phytoene dehydrogenase-like protein